MAFSPLKLNSEGPRVGYLQSILKRLDFYKEEINYVYDEDTKLAVEKFQTSQNISADGIVGEITENALMPYLTGLFTYTVKQGDTLTKIAKQTGAKLPLLISANDLSDPDILYIGQKITVPFLEKTVPANIKYSSEILELNLSSLLKRYPFLDLSIIGKSVLGKDLYAIRFGNGEIPLIYNATHHANEWITSLLLMKYLENLSYSYVMGVDIGGKSAKEIFDGFSLYFVPMVNPDGTDLVTGEIEKDSLIYKKAESLNYPQLPFPSGWKANIKGTDLNLNYPAGWRTARKIKYEQGYTSPAPRDYVGPYPFSAPESVAMGQFTKNISPLLTLAYHSQGEIIYWKYKDFLPKGSEEIADEFARLSGYSAEITPMSSGNAGYKDWYIKTYNRPGYTVEVGKGKSPLPLTQFPKIYRDNVGILSSAPFLIKKVNDSYL